ncbi:MAG: glycoside hydrolase family 30 protein [Deinococcus sp.]
MPNLRTLLISGLLLACAALPGAAPTSAPPIAVVIEARHPQQTFTGWGTSLAWWANALGGWSNLNRDKIADLLFDSKLGLGLNVVRYNLGADDGHNACADKMRPGANIPSFSTGTGTYDWTRDARQRFFLNAARERGANIFEAFANSAPARMLNSGCTAGTRREPGIRNAENLAPEHYDDYARYLATVIKHFADAGLTFQTVEPFNEASSDYWYWDGTGLQEGMNFNWPSENALIPRLKAALKAVGSKTQISAADNNDLDYADNEFNSFSAESQAAITQINVHAYNGTQRGELADLAKAQGKRLWMSEYGCCGGTRTQEHQLDTALNLAATIQRDLTEMKTQAWVYWQAVEHLDAQGQPDHNWGLIKANFLKGETFTLTKPYAGFGQYTRFIRPGMVLLPTADPQTLAAWDAKRGTLAIVAYNDTDQARPVTYDLSGFAAFDRAAQVSRTSLKEDLAALPPLAVKNRQLSVILAARSVTSFALTVGRTR